MRRDDTHDDAVVAPLLEDAYPETSTGRESVGGIKLLQVVAQFAAVMFHNGRGDEFGVLGSEVGEL